MTTNMYTLSAGVSSSQVDLTQYNTLRSFINMLSDATAKDEIKLKATQELSEHFEVITQSSGYQSFLELSMKIFLKILQDGEPQFISENSMQQVRKLILEMIHRLPTTEILRPYVEHILRLILKLLQIDNEENVLVCLRIIIELHKQFRPAFNAEIQQFLLFVKQIYSDLPKHLNNIFEPKGAIRVKDLKELNIEHLLTETYTITPIQTDKKATDGTIITWNLIPKGMLSLKVLQELPIIVVLMYQIYKQSVHQEVASFVPFIMTTITLQPPPEHRKSPLFNKEVFVDFMGAQVKTLSFLAYIIRLFQESIASHAPAMVKGMLGLLQSCPKEVAHLRKELLIAARHILATELRNKFVTSMDRLFDEDLLLGRGWTTHESLRPLAYSTLADLVHHVRQHLSLVVLTKAVNLFSKNVHDETLPTSIQTMSCKLLLNLVDCIRQRSDESTLSRDLLITMLKVFTSKFHTIAKIQLPMIMQKKTMKSESLSSTGTDQINRDPLGLLQDMNSPDTSKVGSIGIPPPANLNITEYRSLVKTLVCGVKTITWGCASCKPTSIDTASTATQTKVFQPPEILIFIDLVHYALEALDIYTINLTSNGANGIQLVKSPGQVPRSKEEKEVLEHFSGVFLMMNSQNFQEIFASTIDYMVERIYKNPALQVIANSFLANPATSPLFATVLVEYLLERMEEMGSNIDRSNLYLRLFKLVFGSVSLFPAENEHMLRPHLHNIVNRSMELAMTAKDPYNYFLLLRALFRSIGGGSHDLLYQEFLPLLPNLLEGLNRLQSGFHKQHMKDLFVELCLTVPVRLSSLLPYLPMLMDPLVSALNGSQTLISQGLRTLELCVDNLQPDFLYDHIQPVRADLMQALWRTLRNQDSAAQVAFRVLGKFGGGNRKMMIEPQRLDYNAKNTAVPAVVAYFQEQKDFIHFPIDKVIETAFNALKTSSTDPFYWRQSWEVIRCYLAASITLHDDKHTLQILFNHNDFLSGNINVNGPQYKSQDVQARQTHQIALTAMFVAAATKELRESVMPTMVAVVRHYTMIAIAQQAGPCAHKNYQNYTGLDPLVLIDALAVIMGHEEKELCKPGHFAMNLILDTATHIMGTKERACRLPMMQYLAERMSSLCYERPWYAKVGGCVALEFLYEHMAMRWLYQHLFVFVKAFMFVIMDLAGEVSSGAIDMAKTSMEKMLRICMVPLDKDIKNEELIVTQNKAMNEVVLELVRQVTSPNTLVREQAMSSLRLIAVLQNKTITSVMDPHREVLADIIPPKKHLLRHQPASAQIGLMDGNTFCTTLEPRLFTIDLTNNYHKLFFHELLTLCEAEDTILNKLDCYKNVTNLVPLRKSALRALAACHYITEGSCRDKILVILLKSLEKKNTELQEAAFECLKKFIEGYHLDKEIIHNSLRPLLLTLPDYRNLTLNGARRLSYLTQLFPSMFNERLCEQLLQHIKKMLENSIAANKGKNFLIVAKCGETEQKITTIMGIFHQIPAASRKFIDSLCRLVLQTEKSLSIEPSCPFREPLVKFLLRYPNDTLELLLNDNNVKDQQWNRFTIYLLKHESGKIFRDIIQEKIDRLIQLIHGLTLNTSKSPQTPVEVREERYEAQHQAVLIIHILIEYDDQWLATQTEIINALKTIWINDLYKTCETSVACDLWHMVAKILLHYFTHHTNDIDLLFLLLKALCLRFIPDFHFLRDFLQNTVAQSYTVDWKRKAFFHFVENFNNPTISQELKAKILISVLIPCFAVSFEKGEGHKLVGAPPTPYQENDNNVVSVFIQKVIDPEKPFANDDGVRIALLQFACLFVECASAHIHDGDANNKRQGNKLRRLMTFAWPCLLGKNCVDPSARYHGHLLLSHIIARLAIHKRIVLQVFHSLLKAHAIEARTVVRQALEVLTPAMPVRMEDGNTMLTHWTKKIIVEEGHSMQQLYHICQLIVKQSKVYYPVRHHLVHHMVNSMQRLGFAPTATVDYRKLSVEIAEVIIKWELQRIKDENETVDTVDIKVNIGGGIKRTISEENFDTRKKLTGESSPQPMTSAPLIQPKVEGAQRSIDRAQCDATLNFLFKLACQINEQTQTPGTISPAENLSRRCVSLFKTPMKPDIWSPPYDLKLIWLDKVFATITNPQANFVNICTALELLTFLLNVLKKDQILTIFRPLQRGLSACLSCPNTRITRLMNSLLSRLMGLFPTDLHHKHEEFDTLYTAVSKMIFEGLAAFEKNPQASSSSLFGTIMILKAACQSNQSYIDRLMMPFMRLLSRLTKEHLAGTVAQQASTTAQGQTTDGTNSLALELLISSLDLVKNRVVVMGVEIRKLFIGGILVGLIEKSTDVRVIKSIVQMIDDWMKNKSNSLTVQQAPTLREKSILLVKLMQYVEKRFSDDQELNAHYLELINYIYRDDQLKQSELTSKLEAAFVAGLRSNQPYIRAKFFEIFDGSMRRRLHDRLLYIICSHAWDSIGQHYWIKQCIELLILTTNTTSQIQNANESHLLPSISSLINLADPDGKNNFVIYTAPPTDGTDTIDSPEDKEDAFDIDMKKCDFSSNLERREESERPVANRPALLNNLISRQAEFLEVNRKIRTEQLLISTSQLCHMDTQLAEKVWLDIFPRLWSILDDGQQQALNREFIPFLSSGTHVIQKDCHPSPLNTFVEALAHCTPRIHLPPNLMTYLGKAHNLWHRMTLLLEDLTLKWPIKLDPGYMDAEPMDTTITELDRSSVFDPLSQMYSALHEEDLWAGLWLKYAKYPETNSAIAYEQMGFFEEAQGAYDLVMSKFKQEIANGPAPLDINSELILWENHWIRCAKELNQWDILLDYAQLNKEKKFFLIMESAWRVPDWTLMKQALLKVEQTCPKQEGYKVNLYRGFLAILNQEDQHLPSVERYVEVASAFCMREWRRLPSIVSHIHLPILQSAQQIMELQEACQIHQGLIQGRTSSFHDMKAIVKTWRNRLPVVADDLSHWSDIFTWRQHHYQIIISHLDKQPENKGNMMGVHASVQAIIHFGKIARKHNLAGVCQDSLSRIYTIPSVPIIDCFQKIRQQVKCYLQMASIGGRNELNSALEVIESTNLTYFSPEMIAEILAMKGQLLSQLGKSDDANKAFSAAAQMHDNLIKVWALWGDYLEQLFTRESRQMHFGICAITCFLHACRHQNESKSRKYLAKVLWLLSYDDDKSSLMEALEKYANGVPPLHWLPWIPQLLCCLVHYEGNVILNLLSQIGRMFPQAVYFPIRTLYLTLKIEQREKHKSAEQALLANRLQTGSETPTQSPALNNGTSSATSGDSQATQLNQGGATTAGTSTGPIRATPSMWRCSKVMHVQREIHPTILSSLEGIVDQMVWFRENWYEEVLRQLRQGLIKCYAIAFENRSAVNEATITPHTLNFVKKLVSTFGIGIENISSSVASTFASAASESLAKRAQATVQDPLFQKMKGQFTSDFDFSQPGSMKLHNLIGKLKKWIKIIEMKTKQLPKSFLIEEKCRFLSHFSQKTAEVELPGELLLPRHSHYHIRIARFMPRVEIVQKHNTAARRLYIRGTNGKIYPYLVVNDSGLEDARREERVLQLLRMLNQYLAKQKETSRRFLHITVPRVVPVSPQMRLVEDNPASISLLDIYKVGCQTMSTDLEHRTQVTRKPIEYDASIARYYERLAEVQCRGSQTNHTVLRDIFREIQSTMVPKTLFKNWATSKFKSATDYWQFRKMFTLQLSLACLCEYSLHLTRLNADMMYVHQDSGLVNISYFKFDVDVTTGELDANRPVPFRLTPNLVEFLNNYGISGPLTASAIATARCLVQPNFKLPAILRAILQDEIISVHKKRPKDEKPILDANGEIVQDAQSEVDMEKIITVVNKAVNDIMLRLNSISYFDNVETNKMTTLVQAASNPDNLCRMDPAWHPCV